MVSFNSTRFSGDFTSASASGSASGSSSVPITPSALTIEYNPEDEARYIAEYTAQFSASASASASASGSQSAPASGSGSRTSLTGKKRKLPENAAALKERTKGSNVHPKRSPVEDKLQKQLDTLKREMAQIETSNKYQKTRITNLQKAFVSFKRTIDPDSVTAEMIEEVANLKTTHKEHIEKLKEAHKKQLEDMKKETKDMKKLIEDMGKKQKAQNEHFCKSLQSLCDKHNATIPFTKAVEQILQRLLVVNKLDMEITVPVSADPKPATAAVKPLQATSSNQNHTPTNPNA